MREDTNYEITNLELHSCSLDTTSTLTVSAVLPNVPAQTLYHLLQESKGIAIISKAKLDELEDVYDRYYSSATRAEHDICVQKATCDDICEAGCVNVPECPCEECDLVAENEELLQDNCDLAAMLNGVSVRQIFYSDKKGEEVVVVMFEDGEKVITRPHGGDAFDLKVGVALAIAEKMFGTKTQFSKFVKKTAKNTSVKPTGKKAAKTKAASSDKPKNEKSIK